MFCTACCIILSKQGTAITEIIALLQTASKGSQLRCGWGQWLLVFINLFFELYNRRYMVALKSVCVSTTDIASMQQQHLAYH